MNVHLIDGTWELFRAYYSRAPKRTGPRGDEVGAAWMLARSMLALLAEDGVTHVAIAFDHVIESFRNALFEGYKTGDGIDPVLHAQFGLAEEVAAALGLVVWPMVEFEADDALATGAARFAERPEVARVYVCSPDKDLGQCVRGDRVVQLDRMRKAVLDEGAVRAKMGVGPRSIPDYLALVGDSADGIPGLPRWGAKSAGAVLARYERLEAIPDDPAAWDVSVRGAATLAEVLAARRDDALLYRQLATLRTDAPLAETLDDLRWRGPDLPALERLARDVLGDARLLDRLPAPR